MSIRHSTVKSFSFAFEGIKTALKNEPNFRIHLIIAFTAIVLGVILQFNTLEFAVLILTIGLVLLLELINTSLESLVDIVSPEIQKQAKIAKDVSAAAVFLSALLSLIIAAFLFLPKIF